MSTKKKESPPPSGNETGVQTAPTPKPARKPRTPKNAGPASRAVEKDGKVVALVLNSLSDQAAVEMVTGKYTARVVGISEGIILARTQELPVLDQANPAAE